MKKLTIKKLQSLQLQHKKLIAGVIRQFGGLECFIDSYNDVLNHGIAGGYSGFIWYAETTDFTKRYCDEILALVEEQAESMGIGIGDFLGGFSCFKDFTQSEILRGVYSKKGADIELIFNGLAWYAAEEVCRMAYDYMEGYYD